MKDQTNIIALIEETIKTCSKGGRAIGGWILAQYDKAAFMTAARLAHETGVSEATVVRFARTLGFSSYAGLQTALQEIVRTKMTGAQRLEVALEKIGPSNVLDNVLHADMERIRKTLDEISPEDFERAVDILLEADTVYLLGFGSSKALTEFLAVYLHMMIDKLKVIDTADSSGIFQQLLKIKKEDAIIGISFPRYSKRTIKALHYARDSGASVVCITDGLTSPVCAYADAKLVAKSDMTSFVDSLTAPLSVINALIAALAMRKKDEVHDTLLKLENIWDEYDIYEKN